MQHKLEIVQGVIRVFAGILFFFQGYDKLFKVKISGVINTFLEEAENHHIYRPLVTLMAWYTSIIELLCGFALLIGFFTDYSLVLLSVDLILAAFAFSFLQPMWDMKHLFPRFILVIALLLLPEEWNKFSIDFLINK